MEDCLTAHYQPDRFACKSCGGAAITFPDVIHDGAELVCAGCSVSLGTWGDFKERIRQVVLSEIESNRASPERASSDIPINSLTQFVSRPDLEKSFGDTTVDSLM